MREKGGLNLRYRLGKISFFDVLIEKQIERFNRFQTSCIPNSGNMLHKVLICVTELYFKSIEYQIKFTQRRENVRFVIITVTFK